MKKSLYLFVLLALILVGGIFFRGDGVVIENFDDCVAAGNPVAKSYPAQCTDIDGNHFIQDIGNEFDKSDLIRITSPRPNQTIVSPLVITGEARGTWFFEGDFPIRIEDTNGNVIAESFATAHNDWMTEEFVSFSGTISFDAPIGEKGTLILQKDNPSNLPELDDALIVPVIFGESDSITCTPVERDIDACIEIYQPVCGLVQVQCVTTPCPPVYETFSNSCHACSNSLVQSYTEGECSNE